GHSAGAVRQLARRAHEDRVSQRARPALRAHDAGDLRGAFQLLVPAAVLGGLRRGARRARKRCAVHLRVLLRPAAQLSPSRLAGVVPVPPCAATIAVTVGWCCPCAACPGWSASRPCAAGSCSWRTSAAARRTSRTPP